MELVNNAHWESQKLILRGNNDNFEILCLLVLLAKSEISDVISTSFILVASLNMMKQLAMSSYDCNDLISSANYCIIIFILFANLASLYIHGFFAISVVFIYSQKDRSLDC